MKQKNTTKWNAIIPMETRLWKLDYAGNASIKHLWLISKFIMFYATTLQNLETKALHYHCFESLIFGNY